MEIEAEKQKKACTAYKNMKQSFSKKTKSKMPQYYGGAYVCENVLNVNVTDKAEKIQKEIQEVAEEENVVIKKVKYSYNELSDEYENILKKVKNCSCKKDIVRFYIDEENNKVVVVLKDKDCKGVFQKNISDSELVEFKYEKSKIELTKTAYKPGSYLTIGNAGYSAGFPCIKVLNGGATVTSGIITAAHANKTGEKAYTASGNYFGKVVVRKYSDRLDAAYVRFLNTSQYTLSYTIKYSGSALAKTSASNIPVGTKVYKVGNTTQLTWGKVISNSTTVVVDGNHVCSDYIQADYKSAAGDSGGLVYADYNGKYGIVGISVASNSLYSYVVKCSNILKDLDVLLK